MRLARALTSQQRWRRTWLETERRACVHTWMAQRMSWPAARGRRKTGPPHQHPFRLAVIFALGPKIAVEELDGRLVTCRSVGLLRDPENGGVRATTLRPVRQTRLRRNYHSSVAAPAATDVFCRLPPVGLSEA